MPEYPAGENCECNAQQIEAEYDVLSILLKESCSEEGVDCQSRAATHERRHRYGHQPVAVPAQAASGHDGGHIAAEADDQGHKGIAW